MARRAVNSTLPLAMLVIVGLLALAPVAGAAVGSRRLHSASGGAGALRALTAVHEHADTGPLLTTSPIRASRIKGLNYIVKPFKLHLLYCDIGCKIPIPHGEYQLAGFQLTGFYKGDVITGGCLACTGPGHFQPYTLQSGHRLTERVKGAKYMNDRTSFFQGLLRPATIGRIEGYQVQAPPKDPRAVASRCLGADTVSNAFGLIENRQALPLVPCAQNVPVDAGGFATPIELQSAAASAAAVAVDVSGERYISLFKSSSACRLDAQAEWHHTGVKPLIYHVHGKFVHAFSIPASTRPGHICEYVQIGGTYDGVPDGRVTLLADHPYYAGDSVAVTAPPATGVNGVVPATISGNASRREELWVFLSTTPCQATAAAEAKGAYGFYTVGVDGSFTQAINSVAIPSSSDFCAYLTTGLSTTAPSGLTLTGTAAPVAVDARRSKLSGADRRSSAAAIQNIARMR